ASGFIEFDGAAKTFTGGIASGDARFTVDSPAEFRLDVSSGDAKAHVTGTTPGTVELDVASGDVQLTLPKDEYNVSQDVASGDVRNELRTSPDAAADVDVKVSSGRVSLTSAR